MSTKMTKPLIKMKNKNIKCHIVKWANVIKMFWTEYVRKNEFQTEDRTKFSCYNIENYSDNQKQSIL